MIKVEIKDGEIRRRLEGLLHRCGDLTPLMKNIGEALLRSTDDRFRAESDPEGKPWRRLAPATLKAKRRRGRDGLKILSDGGNLRGNIHYRAEKDRVSISSPEPYAAIHQFGGRTGRGHETTIPARPFFGVGPDDRREILALTHDFLKEER